MKPYYITTAIDYTNAAPHIGHAYEKVLADVMARFQRLNGREVYFLTGVDQHGQKVQKSAASAGLSPQVFVDGVTAHFTALWKKLDVRFDGWAATTDDCHKRVVQAILQKLHDAGQLYKKSHTGFYSVRQEQFLTDKERGLDGQFGEEWGEVVELQEENWYFKLSEHVEWLKGYIKSHPGFIFPANRAKDVINALEGEPQDLCISRPVERLSWGIPLPFDEKFVNYVWFDALTNYLSFAGYMAAECGNADLPAFSELWPAEAQVIGKDILFPPHALYWTTMLHALGFSDDQMPRLIVHGWWNVKGAKMSKSLGNVIDPSALADKLTPDGLRYYLMRDIATGYDADFSDERVLMSYNKELAGGLGNLLNRTLNMAHKYRAGKLATAAGHDDDENRALRQTVNAAPATYGEKMNAWEIHEGIAAAWKIVTHANQFVDITQPFKLAKDPAQTARLDSVLHHLAEALVHVSVLLSPVIPAAAKAMQEQLGWACPAGFQLKDLAWGLLEDGHQLGQPSPLFPRIEVEA